MTDEDRMLLDTDIAHAEAPDGRPVLKAYRDSVGVWTIGLGTNLQELTIDEALAFRFLRDARRRAERELEAAYPWYRLASARRQRAFTEMHYNLGHSRFSGFTRMIAAAERGDWQACATEALDSKWAREDVGPIRSQRIADMISLG